MSFFHQYWPEEIPCEFTHKGWLFCLCPVYIDFREQDAPRIVERNWIPEWWMLFAEFLFGCYCTLMSFASSDWVPMFPILVTGEIDGAEKVSVPELDEE